MNGQLHNVGNLIIKAQESPVYQASQRYPYNLVAQLHRGDLPLRASSYTRVRERHRQAHTAQLHAVGRCVATYSTSSGSTRRFQRRIEAEPLAIDRHPCLPHLHHSQARRSSNPRALEDYCTPRITKYRHSPQWNCLIHHCLA